VGLVQCARGPIDQRVDFGPRDDQWGRNDHPVTNVAHNQLISKADLARKESNGACVACKCGAVFFVRCQLQRAHMAANVGLSNHRMIRQCAPFFSQIWRSFQRGFFDQLFLLEDPEVFQCNRTGDRVPGIGIPVIEVTAGIDAIGDTVGHDGPTDGRVAGRQTLGDGHDVRADAKGLAAEPIAGSAKSANDLIGNQQNVMGIANTLDFGPIGRWRDDNPACALNGFRDKCRDIISTELFDFSL
jgi:hypothetical protein